ncbi:hypothetical protein A2W15_03690 [Candidatus Woesebacteria bacterium RBG_16_41_13]|nr:MAG: hypothetical protein A2W15_03690 [Candidatus Woesebacteria bacterium RBG_16_41_13]
MSVTETEQQIWGRLLTVSPRGFLQWKEDIYPGFDARNVPERFVYLTGGLAAFDEYEFDFAPAKLKHEGQNEFTTKEKETDIRGLFRTLDLFQIEFTEPREILLVGSYNQDGLFLTIGLCKKKGWNGSHITLVDQSDTVLSLLSVMGENGYYDWQAGVTLIKSDITDYKPKVQPDIVFGDILNTWMTREYSCPSSASAKSPYNDFEAYLRYTATNIKPNGWFFSRCMIFPDDQQSFAANRRSTSNVGNRVDTVLNRIGTHFEEVDKQALSENLDELFINTHHILLWIIFASTTL